MKSPSERIDAFQRRHRWAGFPIAVVYKYVDDQGNYLAALITYYAFLSLFPLLLLATSILGFVLHDNKELQQTILDGALAQFPVIGDQLAKPEGLHGSRTAVIIGIAGSLYGALGVAQATQNAMNTAWSVPRNRRPNPILARLRSLVLLCTAGLGILATTFLSTLGSDVDAFGTEIGWWLKLLLSVAAIAINAGVFIFLFRLATTHAHSLKRTVPGAITAALLWQALQVTGTFYVGHVVKNSSITSGVFAVVLGMIAWIYLASVSVVFSVEINVVKAHRLYPRALLTPFTDNVDLTLGDQRAYADYAVAQRSKDFQAVRVSFANQGQNLTARKKREKEDAAGQEGVSGGATPRTADRESGEVRHTTADRPHEHH